MKHSRFRISSADFDKLHRHLFPGDGDEHGAVLLAGISESSRETRFLVRQVLLAKDGVDYVPGRRGYRMLTADFVAKASHMAAKEHLCYFAVHCHGGRDSVSFSDTDLASHQRGYPALLDITCGGPVGALVFAENAVAGEIWTRSGTHPIDSMTVVGLNLQELFPAPPCLVAALDVMFHRQFLVFGEVGQQRLAKAKVGIIGLGGVGSLVNEVLARVGVGEIVAVDPDKLEPSNRSRVVGSRRWDSADWLVNSKWCALKRIGEWLAKPKVEVARRVAREANHAVRFQAIRGDIVDRETALKMADVDYLFLCADTMQSRLVFNALVHQYLIPGVQIGSKVMVNDGGIVGDVFSVSRMILPFGGGGCLFCNQLIDAGKLQDEAISEEERKRQAYVKDVKAPSVITLNAVGAAQGVNDFLMSLQGMFQPSAQPGYRQHFARERHWAKVGLTHIGSCMHCGVHAGSVFGKGDRASLPCR
jgi:hypothetical protein